MSVLSRSCLALVAIAGGAWVAPPAARPDGFTVEDVKEIVIPDDTHHFLRHSNWVKVDAAAAEFLERKLAPR
jgi:hypothetical protein